EHNGDGSFYVPAVAGEARLIKEAYDEYLRLRREVYGEDAEKKRPVTLMDMATIGAKYLKARGAISDLDESEEINACSIRVKTEIAAEPGAGRHSGEGSFYVSGTGDENSRDGHGESEEINACSIRVKAEIAVEPGAGRHNGDGSFYVSGTGDESSRDGHGESEDWLVMFKNETHNHPTEIEPFGGAATCLGGAIRDPLSGRAYVYQAMRVTGSGDPGTSIKDTLPGKLTQYQITRGAAGGYSSYGNQIGLATGLVDEIYDNSYIAKRLEIGAVVGAAPAANVVRESPAPGDAVLMIGGRTGRDGIGGATGSSKEHTEESILTAGAEVQKGNPPIERDIQRLFRRAEAAQLIKRCNDFGAGGISVAIGELAPGIDVWLDRAPKKYEGLDGTELAISESQERMAVVVSEENVAAFSAYAAEENIEVTNVAVVTDTGRFRMFWRAGCILDLSRDFLDTNGVMQERRVEVRGMQSDPFNGIAEITSTEAFQRDPARPAKRNVSAALCKARGAVSCPGEQITRESLLDTLSNLNVAGKRGLIERFDSTIGAGTLLMPLGGKRQLTPAAGMAAKLPVLSGDTHTATLMSYGFDPVIAKASPFHSAIYAVLDSCAKIAAMGGDTEKIRLSLQEYFPKLGRDPKRWALPVMALLGALKAQLELGVPAIGGKDSMSGSFGKLDVAPTLVSFALCTADARHILSPEFKKAGSRLVFLECPRDEMAVPDFMAFKHNMKRVHALAQEGKLLSANTVSHGGLFAAVAKMALGNGIGAWLDTSLLAPRNDGGDEGDWIASSPSAPRNDGGGEGDGIASSPSAPRNDGLEEGSRDDGSGDGSRSGDRDEGSFSLHCGLTGESYGSLLLEVDGSEDPEILFDGLSYSLIGETVDSGAIEIKTAEGSIVLPLEDIEEHWEAPLAATFPVEADPGTDGADATGSGS
ncbi:MAG: AIR synthase-related protein, partial [Defluviitaleaceae bacterium]|nr:AIR synthase-related protein [Defluviitaleaceae bacterium]